MTYDCQTCGACCWAPGDTEYYVPLEPADVARLQPLGLPMRLKPDGTASLGTRALADGRRVCVAFGGVPGQPCTCTIYADRPDACRRYEVGGPLCRTARQWLGLPEPAPTV